MVICWERGANDMHIVQVMPLAHPSSFGFIKIQTGLKFPVAAYRGYPGSHHTTTVLRPFFRDHSGEPVPEENF